MSAAKKKTRKGARAVVDSQELDSRLDSIRDRIAQDDLATDAPDIPNIVGALPEAAKRDPSDASARAALIRSYPELGDFVEAAEEVVLPFIGEAVVYHDDSYWLAVFVLEELAARARAELAEVDAMHAKRAKARPTKTKRPAKPKQRGAR
jgi:hypothetical protein